MPSFDIVSELDKHEVTNAVDQANREVQSRYDFKGVAAKFELNGDSVQMEADVDFQLKQMIEVLRAKLISRGIDIKCLEEKDPELSGVKARQELMLKQGLDQPTCKKITKQIKDAKLKVQAQIQGEKVRVTGKKRDDLQQAIALLKDAEIEMPLQFNNFRD
ncbi:YajQ family cyclic di-GMP-binding protein [Neptunomonas concharum]|uniref:Nucleotide-binding protein F0U83_12285 n=1 Tax=Neptunomonas concharum TaxID=1031538 RepID=A0A5P1RCQ7_9GAMM|nr:YajQ family cyclic di-GMP-binding protein [Neptunomonas concharum]QEQ97430.1 YajQ family cyclic di-GMP-binding protein [Neptunomonas concharum]